MGIALSAIIAFGVQIVRSDEAKLDSTISAKQSQLSTYSDEIDEAKVLSGKIDTVDILLDKELKFSVLLQEIGRLVPPGGYLTQLYLTTDIKVNLNLIVTVRSKEMATQLQQNLLHSDLFTGADIQSISKTTGNRFSVNILVSYDEQLLSEGLQ
jgi:Tfp pilus assembly protein PilN